MIRESGTSLTSVIAKLRELASPETLARIAEEALPDIQAQMVASYGAGQAPDGVPWQARVDGSKALPNASEGLSASTAGGVSVLTILPPYTYHQARRPMLPTSTPSAWGAIFSAAVERVLGASWR